MYSVQSKSFTTVPGMTVEIQISVLVQSAPLSVRGNSLEDRQCRLGDELSLSHSMFNEYGPELCQYECSLRIVKPEYGCVPWDVPFSHVKDETVICSESEATLFKERLNNLTKGIPCEECVLPRCNSRLYNTKVKHSLKNPGRLWKHVAAFRPTCLRLMS